MSAPPDVRERWDVVARAQAGDVDAFARIYSDHRDAINAFVWSKTRNRALAQDITQDVFVRCMRALGNITYQGRDIRSYLYTIARNMVTDYFKSGRYRFEFAVDDMAAIDHGTSPDTASIALEHLGQQSDHTLLLDAIGKLTREQRECIMLRFFAERSIVDTARTMGINLGACKGLQYRATRRLAALLTEAGCER